jgi:hypothetical protein
MKIKNNNRFEGLDTNGVAGLSAAQISKCKFNLVRFRPLNHFVP